MSMLVLLLALVLAGAATAQDEAMSGVYMLRQMQNRVDVIETRLNALETQDDGFQEFGQGPVMFIQSADGVIGVMRSGPVASLYDAYGIADALQSIPFWVEQKDANEVYVTTGVLYVRGMTNDITLAGNVAWATNTVTFTAASRLMMVLDFANNTFTFTNVVGSGSTLPGVPTPTASVYYWGVADIGWGNAGGGNGITNIVRNQIGAMQLWH